MNSTHKLRQPAANAVPVSPVGTAVFNVAVYSNGVMVAAQAIAQPPTVRIASLEEADSCSILDGGLTTEHWINGLGGA